MNEFEIDLADYELPGAASTLFDKTGRSSFIYHLGSLSQWNMYATGYQEAATAVYEKWKSTPARQEYFMFPMVFLMRHYLELRLKELLHSASALLDGQINFTLNHKIEELWKALRPALLQVEPNLANDPTLIHTDRLVAEFHARDTGSMAFRYPEDRNGTTHLVKSNDFDLDTFMASMEQVANFFDSASMGISVYLDYKMEMASYYSGS